MASKGETKSQKRISAGKIRKIPLKKKFKWATRVRAGAHSGKTSVPLVELARDLLGVARNGREAKKIIRSGMVSVNGKVRHDYRFNVGLFDVIDVPGLKKKYRALLDWKGRLVVKEIEAEGKLFKICKVASKITAKGKKTQVTTSDGFVVFTGVKSEVKVGDSLKISLPGKEAIGHFPLKKGGIAYITSGKHAGTVAKITEITPSTISRKMLVELEGKDGKFQTVGENIFMVGEKKQEIEF